MRHGLSLALALALGSHVTAAHAQVEQQPRPIWSGNHARPVPEHRLELGLLQNGHYGLSKRLELALHPLWFFALPHVELKALAAEQGPLALAVRGRLAYPTIFLGLVSREGAGGLLPKSSSPPQALQIEGELLGSYDLAPAQTLSAALGVAVAPHASFTSAEMPLLDFPFLYPRFAALYTVLVPRAALYLEGRLWRRLYYDASALGFLMPKLPDVGTAWALEQSLALEYRAGDRVALSLGTRLSEAKYAYATRLHYLPYADVRFGF
ncbi:MAG TPA: hypothetical protein VHB79_21555 [Polyangiaceae bacterium]|nr:hypothetical protein [Polyangiaceae bacterium]